MALPDRATEPAADHASDLIETVRGEIAADPEVLRATRTRRDTVKRVAELHEGTLRAFNSGSVAHGTVNKPVSDADCGLVLDRRSHASLGPEGGGEGPMRIVAEIAQRVQLGVRREFPQARVTTTKRAILVEFNAPLSLEEDPSVDLVVGLTRAGGRGLLIPNLQLNTWDPSDPEEHTRLITQRDAKALRTLRARIVRLTKASISSANQRPVLCSFNVEALALAHVSRSQPLPEALRDFLDAAGKDIGARLTPDPAGVSPPIKLPDGITNADASTRLAYLASKMTLALNARYDRAVCLAHLAEVFPDQLGGRSNGKHAVADALRRARPGPAAVAAFGPASALVNPARAYGEAS